MTPVWLKDYFHQVEGSFPMRLSAVSMAMGSFILCGTTQLSKIRFPYTRIRSDAETCLALIINRWVVVNCSPPLGISDESFGAQTWINLHVGLGV